VDAATSSPDEPFDALTDLFLGEVAPHMTQARAAATAAPAPQRAATLGPQLGPIPQGTARPSQAAPAPLPADDDGPRLRLAGGGDFPTTAAREQFAPRRDRPTLPEDIVPLPSAPVLTLSQEPAEDAGEARPIPTLVPPPARNPIMECVVLANLPVMGSAWASQYTREIAGAASKLIASLRVQGEYVSLELVGPSPDGMALPGAEEFGTLEAAIDAAAELTDRWIVRCDAGQEHIVAGRPIARVLTILTGGDQMAQESCRPLFERLATPLAAHGEQPMVRLAIMGDASPEAKATGEGLAKVAEEILSRPVDSIVCSAKINAAGKPTHTLFNGQTSLDLKAIVLVAERALVAEATGKPAPAPVAPAPSPKPVPVAPAAPAKQPEPAAPIAAPPRVEFTPPPRPAIYEIAAKAPPPVAEPIVREPAPAPKPAPAPIRPQPVARTTPTTAAAATTLASHIAELKPVTLRCPYAGDIEIAVDEDGTLHLLARSASEATDDSALAALLVASSWTEAHIGILAAAAGASIDEHKRPTLHLFTDRPKRSRRLLETNLRVHLLAPVQIGSESGWFCTELN
jgi:outer membrane biosynthesis protein TonB